MARPSQSAPSPATPVLVVDDEEPLRHLLKVILERAGYEVVQAADGEAAIAALDQRPELRVVLCDIRMPRMDGLAFLDAVAERDLRVVMMSAYGTTETAVTALTRGAYDYISKPFRAEEIRLCLERLLERDRLETENQRLRESVRAARQDSGFVGRSQATRAVLDMVARVAGYPSTVLITGESGTGKDLLARVVHELSPRKDKDLVAVNCAAIPANLLESELFGHERGAFTGAVRAHAGLFEQAHGSTLLLDEIGEMPLTLQTRLLRVLQDQRVRRVGGSRDREVDVRVVAATARELEECVAEGSFREDLYYRLNVVRIRIPPLRDRDEDVVQLADIFVQRAASRLGRSIEGIAPGALAVMVDYDWPGNVRQLENAMERAVLLAPGPLVQASDLPPEISGGGGLGSPPPPAEEGEDLSIKRHSADLERRLIVKALERTEGNKSQASKLLDISYKALLYKIKQYGVEP